MIDTAFGANPYRANNRLRTAGPRNGGSSSRRRDPRVMMFDGDKLNHFQPTTPLRGAGRLVGARLVTSWWGPSPVTPTTATTEDRAETRSNPSHS